MLRFGLFKIFPLARSFSFFLASKNSPFLYRLFASFMNAPLSVMTFPNIPYRGTRWLLTARRPLPDLLFFAIARRTNFSTRFVLLLFDPRVLLRAAPWPAVAPPTILVAAEDPPLGVGTGKDPTFFQLFVLTPRLDVFPGPCARFSMPSF